MADTTVEKAGDRIARDPENVQWILIRELLFSLPKELSEDEIVRELRKWKSGMPDEEELHDGVRDLVGLGLLERHGAVLRPPLALQTLASFYNRYGL